MSEPHELSAAEILAAKDFEIERVDVPEWGGWIHIRTMSGSERDALEVSTTRIVPRRVNGQNVLETRPNLRDFRAKTVAACACTSDGRPLFTSDQVAELGRKSARALDRCFEVAQRLNGLSNADVESLAGNSEAGRKGDSGSG